MRESAHTHPCAICEAPVPCDGELLLNHDGFPAVVCTVRLSADAPIDGDL